MSGIHLTAFIVLAAVVLPSTAVAQRSLPSSRNMQNCQTGAGATRTRSNCESEQTTTVRTEQEIKISVDVPDLTTRQCAVSARTGYQQRNTIARVESTLEIADCTAASGTFTVALRLRDATGETKALEFSEPWQRSDDQDVEFTADYPIGENMFLVSARVRALRCTCADPLTEADSPKEE